MSEEFQTKILGRGFRFPEDMPLYWKDEERGFTIDHTTVLLEALLVINAKLDKLIALNDRPWGRI